ncbi:MAG: hypothetical protein WC658_04040 [Candidatus Omnitrophota bacterium]
MTNKAVLVFITLAFIINNSVIYSQEILGDAGKFLLRPLSVEESDRSLQRKMAKAAVRVQLAKGDVVKNVPNLYVSKLKRMAAAAPQPIPPAAGIEDVDAVRRAQAIVLRIPSTQLRMILSEQYQQAVDAPNPLGLDASDLLDLRIFIGVLAQKMTKLVIACTGAANALTTSGPLIQADLDNAIDRLREFAMQGFTEAGLRQLVLEAGKRVAASEEELRKFVDGYERAIEKLIELGQKYFVVKQDGKVSRAVFSTLSSGELYGLTFSLSRRVHDRTASQDQRNVAAAELLEVMDLIESLTQPQEAVVERRPSALSAEQQQLSEERRLVVALAAACDRGLNLKGDVNGAVDILTGRVSQRGYLQERGFTFAESCQIYRNLRGETKRDQNLAKMLLANFRHARTTVARALREKDPAAFQTYFGSGLGSVMNRLGNSPNLNHLIGPQQLLRASAQQVPGSVQNFPLTQI